jgi:hypothetical protein
LVLPSSYALGPFRAIWALLTLVFRVLAFVMALLFFVISSLLALVMPRPDMPPPVPPRLEPLAPPGPGSQAGSFPWLEVLASALFWVVILTIVSFALARFVRERWPGWGLEGVPGTRWHRFVAWLRQLWRRWQERFGASQFCKSLVVVNEGRGA